MQVLFVNAADTSRHVSSANTAIYPNLGLLTLMSSLKRSPVCQNGTRLGYLDGTVYGNEFIRTYIEENYASIAIICFSALTANYGASVDFANLARALNPKITVIFGNDHFSALYERVIRNQSGIDYGFYGSDVVEGFTDLVNDLLTGNVRSLASYPGLVYREEEGEIKRNPENPNEYGRLPLVDYSLVDILHPHNDAYLAGQQRTYHFMRGRGLRSQVVDIGRGCIKFAGARMNDIPKNACDFCGIIPGGKAIASPSAERAWAILKNAYDQGYNYFYVTADELPLTLWSLLKGMSLALPEWYRSLPVEERPKMFGYARAEGFETQSEKINTLVDTLGFDHFFVGFDGLTQISLEVMNKRPVGSQIHDLMKHNTEALQRIVNKGCMVTAGLVVTHLGITPKIMEENYRKLAEIVSAHPNTFAALDFGPLCPIPGSQSFRYLTHPEYAKERADRYGLSVDMDRLRSTQDKYREGDCFEMDELVSDFVAGCCPAITQDIVDEHIEKIGALARKHSIVIGGGV